MTAKKPAGKSSNSYKRCERDADHPAQRQRMAGHTTGSGFGPARRRALGVGCVKTNGPGVQPAPGSQCI